MNKGLVAQRRKLSPGNEVTRRSIAQYFGTEPSEAHCPKHGVYTLNPIGTPPACSVHGSFRLSEL